MKLSKHVLYAIDDMNSDRPDSALLHACIAVDASARRAFPQENKVGVRYVSFIRQYYWILEFMLGLGLNLVETRFENITLKGNSAPDMAEIVYERFRCNHAHGEEVPPKFEFHPSSGAFLSCRSAGEDELHLPDRTIWGLLAICVFAKVNQAETTTGSYYLALGEDHFLICDWWGREGDFRAVAEAYNKTRVKLEWLGGLAKDGVGEIQTIQTLNPPFL